MSNLRDYISSRRSDVKAQIQALKAELRDLDVAEQALHSAKGGASQPEAAGKTRMTIKELILDALKDAADFHCMGMIDTPGLDALEIISRIKRKQGIDVQRPSLSPQLSRLKEEGRVILEGKLWKLAKENEPPGGSPQGGSETAESSHCTTRFDHDSTPIPSEGER